jgi:hypothetical protein
MAIAYEALIASELGLILGTAQVQGKSLFRPSEILVAIGVASLLTFPCILFLLAVGEALVRSQFMRLPRMTTRRWMVTVLLVAVINASCLQGWRWRLRSRYVAAQHEHLAFRKYYDEGRVTPLKYFEKSEALMAAGLALAGEDERHAIVSGHIARVVQVMRQEEDDLLRGRGVLLAWQRLVSTSKT